MIEQNDGGLVAGLDQGLQLGELARAEIGRDIDSAPSLSYAPSDGEFQRFGQTAELVETPGRIVRRCPVGGH